jgi:glycosyltransferase involved in cell wall biosynthesis
MIVSTQEKPLVSVIMNCLNCEQYLQNAIDSVYAQTYDNWEIIFWDNGSCDKSKEIAKSYDHKLKYFRSEKTSILGTARVSAVEQANGDYFAFLDCDDTWYKDKLQIQMKIFFEDGDNLGMVYGGCEVLYENSNEIVINRNTLPEGNIFGSLVKENFITFVSAIVKKEVFYASGGFPINIRHSTDYWLFLNISRSYRIRASQEICCTYRFHPNNLSTKNRVLAAKEAIEIVSMFLPDNDAENALKYHYDNLTIAYLKEYSILKSINNLFKYGGIYRISVKLLMKIIRIIRVKS